jgi:hypothetical protein
MTRVPLPALVLGLAGLSPFLYALLLLFSDPGRWPTLGLVASEPEGGAMILERFGAVVLGFMAGCLWGFGSAPGRAPRLPVLGAAAVPALLAALALRGEPALSCMWLAFGFVVLQTIDVVFQRAGVAPGYWLSLRLPLTAIVIACLLAGAIYG